MALWYRAAFHFTEAELRYGMESCLNVRELAAFFKVGPTTITRYMQSYYDHEHGMSLYDLFIKRKKERTRQKGKYAPKRQLSPNNASLADIFAGKHPKYNHDKLQGRLILEGYLVERCNICGFAGRRITDYKIPLKLAWKNKNTQDHALENLELVCYNCYFMYYGEILARRYKSHSDVYKRERAVLQ